MSLTINTELTTSDGFTVPSGSHLMFQTIFPDGKKEIHYNLKPYRDKSAYTGGTSHFVPQEFNLGIVKALSDSEYSELNTTKVHEYLQGEIEKKIGSGTTEVNI